MSSSSGDEPLRLNCPQCGKKLKIPASMYGRSVACPKCRNPINVPDSSGQVIDELRLVEELFEAEEKPANSSVAYDSPPDLFGGSLKPGESTVSSSKDKPVKPQPTTANSSSEDVGDDDDYRLMDLPDPPTTKRGSLDVDNLDELLAGALADPSAASTPEIDDPLADNELPLRSVLSEEQQPETFRFRCRHCNAPLISDVTQIGNLTRCSQCYEETKVPSPKKTTSRLSTIGVEENTPAAVAVEALTGRPVKRTPAKAESSSRPASTRTPARDPSRPRIGSDALADDYLAAAEVDIEEDKKRDVWETVDYDSLAFTQRVFGFLRDPAVLTLSLIPGALLGGVVLAVAAVIDTFNRDTPVARTLNIAALALLGGPILIGTLMNALAVMTTVANHERRVTEWPAFNFIDAIGEGVLILLALALSAIPGGILYYFLSPEGGNPPLNLILISLSVWLLFPIFLLSMMDNQSLTSPVSSEVTASMSTHAGSWGAMYILTGIAAISLASLIGVFMYSGGIGKFIACCFTPLLIFFYFAQLGNLAASIALIDFSDDDDEEEDDSPIVHRPTV